MQTRGRFVKLMQQSTDLCSCCCCEESTAQLLMNFGRHIENHQCAGGTSKPHSMLVLQPSQSVSLAKGHHALQHLNGCCSCRPLKQSLSRKDIKCLTKLLVDSKSQKVVAVHMVGAEAAEIVQVRLCGSAALDKSSCSSSKVQQGPCTVLLASRIKGYS